MQVNRFANPCSGQTFIEFLIIVPIVLTTALVCAQIVFYSAAHHGVQLAAYKAARSLVVNINSEPINRCLEKMRESSVLCLLNYSPDVSYSVGAGSASNFANVSPDIAKISALGFAKGINTSNLFKRYLYAKNFTKTQVLSPSDPSLIRRGSQLKVGVDFMFSLNIPIANRLLYTFIRIFQKDSTATLNNIGTANASLLNALHGDIYMVKISKTALMQSEN